jgi:hypothetical protein
MMWAWRTPLTYFERDLAFTPSSAFEASQAAKVTLSTGRADIPLELQKLQSWEKALA